MYKAIFSIICFTFLLISPFSKAQNGLDFDGVNDYIQTDYGGISGSSSRTVEAWIKADYVSGQAVLTDWGTFATGARFTTGLIDGKLRVEVSGSGQTGPTVVADSTWHHIAVSYNSTASTNKFTTYIDGVLEQNFDLLTAVNTGSSVDMRIGVRVDGVNSFKGVIDEVRVWNYVRSATEILDNKDSEFCGSITGLTAYHKLNHGIASGANSTVTTSTDDSGNSNDGDLLNFSLSGSSSNWVTGESLSSGLETVNQTLSECLGFTIQVGNNIYSGTGVYVDTISSGGVCDSVVITDLTITPPSQQTQTVVECDGYQLVVGNNTYTTTGVYLDTLIGAGLNGCNLYMTSNLTINNELLISQNYSICSGESIEVAGNEYTSTGTYIDTIVGSAGCDTVLTSNLTVLQDATFSQTFEECEGFTIMINGNTYSETGTYVDVFEGASSLGCDSVVTTNIDIVDLIDTTLVVSGNLLSVTHMGANYQWVNCDSSMSPIMGETGSVFSASEEGSYAVIISDGNCVDTSSCYNIQGIGLQDLELENSVMISPNPVQNIAIIALGELMGTSTVRIVDITGKVEYELFQVENNIEVDMHELNMGIYFVEINDGKKQVILKVLKL